MADRAVGFDHVTLLVLGVLSETDAAFEARLDFFDVVLEALESDVEDLESGPDQSLLDYELESHLAEALARLTEVERVCFVLKHLEQWRVREISEELDINEGRVKQAVFRAVKKLRVDMSHMKRHSL